MGIPRDDKHAAKDLARDLAEMASHLGQLMGEADAPLTDPNYDGLELRLETDVSRVEAAMDAMRRVRLNEA